MHKVYELLRKWLNEENEKSDQMNNQGDGASGH